MTKLITITTDFHDSFATAQLKAVAASLGFNGNLIENHEVSPFSIFEGAFQIATLARYSPPDSVHVGIVDPGVGTARRGIVVKTKRNWFVAPDNGILSPVLTDEGIKRVWKIKEKRISKELSNTFHGRDVFIKVAVMLAQGKTPSNFDCEQIKPETLDKISFRDGQVLQVDCYGNIKVFWTHKLNLGKKIILSNHVKKYEFPIVKTFANVPPGKPLAYLGSNGTLEIAVNLGSAAKEYKIQSGELLNIDCK